MPMHAQPRTVDDIDRDLRNALANRESARREIRRLSDIVVYQTREIDRLLAERTAQVVHDLMNDLG